MDNLRINGSDFVIEKQGKLKDTYHIEYKLGNGAYGSVRRIIHRLTGEVRAVKTIHKTNLQANNEYAAFYNEVSALRALDHPNILKLYEYYQDDKNYYLITEFCSGGELFDRITNNGSFSEATAANYMKQILSVISYCHDRHIIHRDLKPENLLLDSTEEDANLKVIDFGTSQFFTPGVPLTDNVGTSYYIAPEILKRNYDEKCDVWSAGINMYILLCGYPPFSGSDDDQILKKISVGRFFFPSPEWDDISSEAKDLITKMLNPDPSVRISAKDALHHRWLYNASQSIINASTAQGILKNLQSFRSEQKLQKATYSFISSQLATKTEREQMLDLFKTLDTDNSGTISKKELIQGFEMLYFDEINDIESEVNKIMNQVDIDHSGEIDYNEFIAASMSRNKILSKERLESAFKAFDIDSSGTISADELKAILGKYHAYDDEIWIDIIREVDINGDGVIDLREFSEMMLKFS